MKHLILLLTVFLLSIPVFSQETIRSMTYNIAKFTASSSIDRQQAHDYIYRDIMPDLLMVQEAGVNTPNHILGMLNNIENKFRSTTRFDNIVNPADSNTQLIFYNKNMFELVAEIAHPSSTRNINQYTFKLIKKDNLGISVPILDTDGNPIFLEVFVAHLKSSDSSVDRAERSNMIDTFIAALNTINNNRFVIFAGDFNLYSSNEPAYLKTLAGTATIKMKDPINRPNVTMPDNGFNYWSSYPIPREIQYFWQDNIEFQDTHTQNPRGSSGGLDDRFDFILTSENLLNENSSISYIPNSYKVYGNNGNCLNKDITDVSCDGFYNATTRLHARNASDHLPVFMDLSIKSATLSNTSNSNPSISFLSSNVSATSIKLSMDEKLLNSELIIYNQLGQVVKKFTIDYSTISHKNINIDIQNLSNGFYFINNSKMMLKKPLKFIKN